MTSLNAAELSSYVDQNSLPCISDIIHMHAFYSILLWVPIISLLSLQIQFIKIIHQVFSCHISMNTGNLKAESYHTLKYIVPWEISKVQIFKNKTFRIY